jgi:hypothetical protein
MTIDLRKQLIVTKQEGDKALTQVSTEFGFANQGEVGRCKSFYLAAVR